MFFKIYNYVIPTFHSNKSCFKLFRKVSIVQFLIFFRDIFSRCELNNNAVTIAQYFYFNQTQFYFISLVHLFYDFSPF